MTEVCGGGYADENKCESYSDEEGIENIVRERASIMSTSTVGARYRTNVSFVIALSYEYIPMIFDPPFPLFFI
jgi:hypothetical protein